MEHAATEARSETGEVFHEYVVSVPTFFHHSARHIAAVAGAANGQTFYLRSRGQTSSSFENRSGGLGESTRQFYLNGSNGVFASGFE